MKMFKLLFVAVFFTLLTAGASSAFECQKMEIMFIGGTDYAASGGGLWLKNVSGAGCGNLANNASQQFFLADTAHADKKLAVVLTAFSLGKTVYIHATGDGATPGGAVDVVSMSNF